MAKLTDRYNNNPFLPKAGTTKEFTEEELQELVKCEDDPIYFAEKYFKIVSVDKGVIPFLLYDFQKEAVEKFLVNRNLFLLQSRQSGKTSTATVLLLHYALFNPMKTIGILANKAATSREILNRIKRAYEFLPDFLKGGVKEWNKSRVEFENGSLMMAEASSSDAIRGQSLSLLYIDEHAFVDGWEEFSSSVLPTLSSGNSTKMIFSTTPNGLNHSYYYVEGARNKTNDFALVEVPWFKVPGRDDKWKEKTLSDLNHDMLKFEQEFELEFIGSSGTLISGAALKQLFPEDPIMRDPHIKQYKNPIRGHQYILTADVSRGKGLDYSTFSIVDISTTPYEQVCTYRNNMILPTDYGEIVRRFGLLYNDAALLIEINDLGSQVADICFEYEANMIFVESRGRAGKQVSFSARADRGMRTTQNSKMEGCMMLKILVEQKKLLIRDAYTIAELNTFSQAGNSYEAEKGKHDDMVMTLVLFAWLSGQGYLDQLNDGDLMKELREVSDGDFREDLLPFGVIADGLDDEFADIVYMTHDDW